MLSWAGVALSTPFLAWFVVGDLSLNRSAFLSHEYGPYDVGPQWSGYVVGMGTALALAAIGMLVIQTWQRVADLRTCAVAVLLAMAGAVGAYGWRVLTAGFTGDGLGGGIVWLTVPSLIAGLLIGAVWVADTGDRQKLRRTRLFTLAAVLVAPALYGVLFGLGRYDDAAGRISGEQYARVQLGQTRPAVHETLGRELSEDLSRYSTFPRTAPGLRCDYYDDTRGGHAYQLCFRAGVLVSKDLTQ